MRAVHQADARKNRRRSLQIDGGLKAPSLPKTPCDHIAAAIQQCMGVKPAFRDYEALKKEAETAFYKTDDDHNGWLDADELISLAGGSEERVQRLIRVFDIDGNGSLTKDEFIEFYVYLKRTSALGSAEAIKAAQAAGNSELVMLYNALPKLEDALDNLSLRFEKAEYEMQRAKAREKALGDAIDKVAKYINPNHIRERERDFYEEMRIKKGGRTAQASSEQGGLGKPRMAASQPFS